MVIGFNGNLDYKTTSNIAENNHYTKDALKAATGIKTADEADSFKSSAAFALGSTALFSGIPFYRYIRNNKKLKGAMTQDMVNLSNSTQNALKNLKNSDEKLSTRLAKYFDTINQNNKAYSEVKNILSAKAKLPKLQENLANRLKLAEESPNFYRNWKLKRAKSKLANAEKIASKTITPASLENASSKLNVGKFLKSSGAPMWLVFGGLIEGVTEVYPTFKELGSEKGMKQLGKSSVKVIGDTLGFIAGEQMGMAVGSAIGTAILPGIGTAIGAATGLFCGMLGTYAADKFTSKLIGKSERELASENNQSKNDILNKNNLNLAV